MSEENKLYFKDEKEAIFLLLTGIGDEIYSTVDACNTSNETWTAIERLQQGESLNIQDVKTICSGNLGSLLLVIENPWNLITPGKEIAKPVTPQSESVSEEDSDPEQAQRDKDMQKNLALLAKNKTEDTTPRYNNDNQSGQFGNQRTMTVAGARETVGRSQRVKRLQQKHLINKEKIMMCKQAEQGVLLQAEQADWLANTDEEIDE
ncbi:hypothetical protein Tco_0977881 [Tanacetum coccineum]|uniref:Uncharacterized protein n=1 Tax=Tanacetum coccineum TaxID=301880 RepID=A0ABQ5ELD1_9ASTR